MEIIYNILIFCILLKISYVDYKNYHIYDADLFLCLIIIFSWAFYTNQIPDTLVGLLYGALVGLSCFCLGYLISKKESYGMGDLYLYSVMGAYLKNSEILHYFIFVSLFGGLFLLPNVIKNTKQIKSITIPMAPIYILWFILFIFLKKPSIFDIHNLIYNFCL